MDLAERLRAAAREHRRAVAERDAAARLRVTNVTSDEARRRYAVCRQTWGEDCGSEIPDSAGRHMAIRAILGLAPSAPLHECASSCGCACELRVVVGAICPRGAW